jgi:hypothetical protein
MAKQLGGAGMNFLQENILEMMLLIGVIFVSIGFFMFSVPIGFIVTGALIISAIFHLWREETKGGE